MAYFLRAVAAACLMAALIAVAALAARAETPLKAIDRLATEHGPGVIFEVPGTEFECWTFAEFSAVAGPRMWSSNGIGCRPVLNFWGGSEINADGTLWTFAAHGGHEGYGGNEIWQLDLTDPVTPWRLLTLPSPEAQIVNGKYVGTQFQECPHYQSSRSNWAGIRCPEYGPSSGHAYGQTGVLPDGRLIVRHESAYTSPGAPVGAWIVDLADACIQQDRWDALIALYPDAARLNPQNISSTCDPEAVWGRVGDQNPDTGLRRQGAVLVLPQSEMVVFIAHQARAYVETFDGTSVTELTLNAGSVGRDVSTHYSGGAGYAMSGPRIYEITDSVPVIWRQLAPFPAEHQLAGPGITTQGDHLIFWGGKVDREIVAFRILAVERVGLKEHVYQSGITQDVVQVPYSLAPGVTTAMLRSQPYTAVRYLPQVDAHCFISTYHKPEPMPRMLCIRLALTGEPPIPPEPGEWLDCPCYGDGIQCPADRSEPCREASGPTPPPGPFALQAAIDAAAPGDTITIPAGEHFQCGWVQTDGLTIQGEPGAHLRGVACEGKAALLIEASNTTIIGLEISEISVSSGNGSCIRFEKGVNLLVEGLHCHTSQQGLFGGGRIRGGGQADDYSTVTVLGSQFDRLGHGGQAHHVYLSRANEVHFHDTTFRAAITGHLIKSGAALTVVRGGTIDCRGSTDSPAMVDAYSGGSVYFAPDEVFAEGCKPRPISYGNEAPSRGIYWRGIVATHHPEWVGGRAGYEPAAIVAP